MGKQGKARKRRRLESNFPSAKIAQAVDSDLENDCLDEISPRDLDCTARTLHALAEAPKLLKAPECKRVRAALYALRQPDAGTLDCVLTSLEVETQA
jgi:hypothetical protein